MYVRTVLHVACTDSYTKSCMHVHYNMNTDSGVYMWYALMYVHTRVHIHTFIQTDRDA
jgi:hypothetical protein